MDTLSFLALGDSYTIGESVDEADRWPMQLASALGSRYQVPVKIIARTGWTTDELQQAIDADDPSSDYDLVSLLIGVNNQYRGYPFEQYEQEFDSLLRQAISFAGGKNDHVFVVSIPDYGVTPFAASRDPEKIGMELDQYNAKAQEIAAGYGVKFYNITPISREAADDKELVAADSLHPSGKMYRRWVEEVIYPDFILPTE